MVTVHYLDCC